MSKKSKEKPKEPERNSTDHVISFDRPKQNKIGSNDARLNELIAQSYLRDIIKLKK